MRTRDSLKAALQRIPKPWVVGLCAFLACLISAVLLWAYQGRLVFQPDKTLHAASSDYAFSVQDVAVRVRSKARAGQIVHGWWIESPKGNARVVLYLHGNDGNISTSVGGITPLRELGYSIFLIDYRGYGESDGKFPSEARVYEDAQAAWTYLVQERGTNPANLFIYGHSLGGAIAIELALHHPEAAGLIVESSFTSIYDMANLKKPYRVLPVKLILNQRFDSINKVDRLKLPVLYIHGTADEVVPFAMGRRLFEASAGAKTFVAIAGGNHETNAAVDGPGVRAAIANFVNHSASPR